MRVTFEKLAAKGGWRRAPWRRAWRRQGARLELHYKPEARRLESDRARHGTCPPPVEQEMTAAQWLRRPSRRNLHLEVPHARPWVATANERPEIQPTVEVGCGKMTAKSAITAVTLSLPPACKAQSMRAPHAA